MLQKRIRIKHTMTFDERLAKWAAQLKEQAREMPPGSEKDTLIKYQTSAPD
jgi:hypothetical protein